MCLEPGKDLLLFPAHRVGSIQILSVSAAALLHVVSTAPVTIAAHKNPIAIISLDSAGNFVATASSKVKFIEFHHNSKIFYRGVDLRFSCRAGFRKLSESFVYQKFSCSPKSY